EKPPAKMTAAMKTGTAAEKERTKTAAKTGQAGRVGRTARCAVFLSMAGYAVKVKNKARPGQQKTSGQGALYQTPHRKHNPQKLLRL
ncbi:MAG: hypothetical protein K1W21_00165, partial [Oscillospiraceae bacterium]